VIADTRISDRIVRSKAVLERLDWDSRFFGFTVARVSAPRMSFAEAREVAAAADAMQARCVYFLSSDPSSWRAASSAGFDPIDVRLELAVESMPSDAPRTLADRSDESELLAIVREGAFTESRFFRDERFPREKASALFETWMQRGLGEPGWFTIRSDGGFVTCGPSSIQLVAVAEHARGRGIARRLIAGALAEHTARGATRVTVVTQGTNVAAQTLYAACGFRPSSCALWLHRWSDV
jgi:ribosomal protein S18 acetylase RimI-like enzyme